VVDIDNVVAHIVYRRRQIVSGAGVIFHGGGYGFDGIGRSEINTFRNGKCRKVSLHPHF
jgi:hypothetical protein